MSLSFSDSRRLADLLQLALHRAPESVSDGSGVALTFADIPKHVEVLYTVLY